MIALYFGADDLQIAEAIAQLRQTIPEDVADLNIVVLEGKRLKLQALAAACEAFPFLADKRLVLVEGALKQLKAGTERDAIRAYLPAVPPTTDLVFVEGADIDRRSSIFNYFKQQNAVREFQPREGADLQRWLHERARELSTSLRPEAGELLVEYVGKDGRGLLNEVDKLAAYAGAGNAIGPDNVRLLVPDSSESSIFEFVDALASRRLGAALRLLHDLLDDGAAATYLLFMIARQVRILVGVSDLMVRRMPAEAIAAEMGQRPFVVKKAMSQARLFEKQALLRLHDRLVELDHWSKTGRIEPAVALDILIAETCNQQQGLPATSRTSFPSSYR